MKIETYFNGQLTEINEIDSSMLLPNFTEFVSRMFWASSYTKLLKNSTDQQAKSRLELAAVRLELKFQASNQDIETFKLIWDAVVDAIPLELIENHDSIELRQIAESTNMPFTFGLGCKIELK